MIDFSKSKPFPQALKKLPCPRHQAYDPNGGNSPVPVDYLTSKTSQLPTLECPHRLTGCLPLPHPRLHCPQVKAQIPWLCKQGPCALASATPSLIFPLPSCVPAVGYSLDTPSLIQLEGLPILSLLGLSPHLANVHMENGSSEKPSLASPGILVLLLSCSPGSADPAASNYVLSKVCPSNSRFTPTDMSPRLDSGL